ncbi:MAG: polysaccharide biosynthesis protein [Saprospirales bacterium]|nr:polysaccharide biosynthesis protein [Saprospirales bacterium]MBK8923540.1 polysaccharide biosynthesis protein [Saprospirales bacterium]
MSLLKKLAGETALYGLSSIVGRLLNMLLVPFYTRVLATTNEYGAVIDLYATSAFIMVLFSYRMESAFFRFGTPPEDRDRAYSAGMWSLLTSTAIIAAALLLFAQPIAGALAYPQHPEYVRWFALILAFDCLAELPFARLRLEQRPRRFVFIKLLNIGVNIGMNLFWLVFCPWAAQHGITAVHAVWSPGLGVEYIFLSNLLASLVTLFLLIPQLRMILRVFDRSLWWQMITYAAPLIIVSLAGIVDEMFSRAMLKYLLPGTPQENLGQVGIFGANYKLAALITLFTQAYRYAAEPFFFRHAKEDHALHTQAQVTKWFTITSAGGMLGILLFLDLVKYFIAPKYWGGLHVVPVLLTANLLLGVYYNFSIWYRLKDRTGLGAWISVIGALVTIALNMLLIPVFGYTGAAFVTLACYTFMSVATWYTGRRHYPVPYELGRMAGYVVLALGLWALSLFLNRLLPDWPALVWGPRVLMFAAFAGAVYQWELKKDFPAVVRVFGRRDQHLP